MIRLSKAYLQIPNFLFHARSDYWMEILKTLFGYSSPPHPQISFMKGLIDSGASAITLHLRYTDDRPRVPCHKEFFPVILKAMKEYAPNVPICYNGDIFSYKDVQTLRELYPSVGLMIGRDS